LWREGVATIVTFRGDTLFQQNPVSWRQMLIATGKKLVARSYYDNVNFSWRYFVSTKFTIVVLHNFCSIQNVCRKKLPPQFEGFVAILYLNKFLFRGAK
jgi:hypothetical protein